MRHSFLLKLINILSAAWKKWSFNLIFLFVCFQVPVPVHRSAGHHRAARLVPGGSPGRQVWAQVRVLRAGASDGRGDVTDGRCVGGRKTQP